MWLAIHEPARIEPPRAGLHVGTLRRARELAGARGDRARPAAWRRSPIRTSISSSRSARIAIARRSCARTAGMMVSAEREGYAGCCEALADWDPGR